jgi:hypothetical protein
MFIHGVSSVMFVDDINVIINDIDVGALQNKVDRVIIDLEFWFQTNYLIINVHNSDYVILIAEKVSN